MVQAFLCLPPVAQHCILGVVAGPELSFLTLDLSPPHAPLLQIPLPKPGLAQALGQHPLPLNTDLAVQQNAARSPAFSITGLNSWLSCASLPLRWDFLLRSLRLSFLSSAHGLCTSPLCVPAAPPLATVPWGYLLLVPSLLNLGVRLDSQPGIDMPDEDKKSLIETKF